jgi:hypothetical protein
VVQGVIESAGRLGSLVQSPSGVDPLLVYAYAWIGGKSAFPALIRLANNSDFRALHHVIEESLALSLGITSWIDDNTRLGVPLCRPMEPRDALDKLIVGFFDGDRESFVGAMGPVARASWERFVGPESWKSARARILSNPVGSLGYRFAEAGVWSEGAEEFSDAIEGKKTYPNVSDFPVSPAIDTVFNDSVGSRCGRWNIVFDRRGTYPSGAFYLVDSPDIEGLLRLVASCAAASR